MPSRATRGRRSREPASRGSATRSHEDERRHRQQCLRDAQQHRRTTEPASQPAPAESSGESEHNKLTAQAQQTPTLASDEQSEPRAQRDGEHKAATRGATAARVRLATSQPTAPGREQQSTRRKPHSVANGQAGGETGPGHPQAADRECERASAVTARRQSTQSEIEHQAGHQQSRRRQPA